MYRGPRTLPQVIVRLDRLAVIIDCDDDGGYQVDLGED